MIQQTMPYERNTSKLPDYPQTYVFPGDECVSLAEYASVMANSYLSKLSLVEVMWAKFGVPLDQENHERTKRLFITMSWLDHFIDEAPDRDSALRSFNQTIASTSEDKLSLDFPTWARPELAPSVQLLANALRRLQPTEVDGIARNALRIGEISTEKASITSVKEYTATLIEEGTLTSDLAVEVMSSELKNTAAYKNLYDFNRKAMIGATILDGMLDLGEDNENNLAAVPPTLWNKLYMLNKGASYAPGVLHGLGIVGIRSALKVKLNHGLKL